MATERHDLLGAYLWNDTIAQLAALHDCYTASNPHGASYFYVPWMSVDDRRDPRRWIAYEAAAAPHWRCIVAAANRMSRASRAGNRIRIVPAASALASLVAQAGDLGLRLDGARSDPAAAIALLFEDDVHPTRLASYVLALVTHAVIAGRSPIGAWAPEEIAPDLAARLQALADRVAAETAREPEPDLDACTATLRSAATEVLWPYMERAAFRRDRGLVGGRIEYLRQVVNWRWMLWRDPAWSPYPAAGPVPDARAAVSPGTALGRP
ncbi:hypothetical protein Q8W71_14010 [Methylobacterium sp. NEAU 140]|uniref:hypothetical protein n=1 Tax=Methylobacterium sp. NEAU 140 TaxID=3064945 RepID=UPI002733366D|nr:hypothetical protein [Methylobacterium sp. NEAU 140]MDP4023746.1 hypothetical protein [Methylobacterium sp. NEAU 140]